MDFKLRVIRFILKVQIILVLWGSSWAEHVRIFLDQDESFIIPKYHNSELKILPPFFAPPPPTRFGKRYPYHKNAPVFIAEFKPGLQSKEVALEELIKPVSLPSYRPHIHRYHFDEGIGKYYNRQDFEDVKPVKEHIEDDLKYDFRTKTHSFS